MRNLYQLGENENSYIYMATRIFDTLPHLTYFGMDEPHTLPASLHSQTVCPVHDDQKLVEYL